ncbi:protein aurora borealis [Spea bombifrons]|uniref:protein aurora borealis n=1 Tax=Spea bombifrons TaxID=233779 RepID=UPI00234998CD|nr:protein aurora borealis [Spea bombifrons]XP_053311392.1 protein aurora borealis [Spea bombifrons]
MGDVRTHLTPETPGRAAVLNPFESPSDYYSLQEPFVSSPTVFKPAKSSATPRQFRWSIDQLAAINPVEIDPEDIHRQALYLSHAKTDKEIEERRQKAIEEFFLKRTIVPSPWTQHEGKQAVQFHSTKCVDLHNESPLGRIHSIQPGKSTVGCQTQLSLPVDFNLEKVLGEYFRAGENADHSQENLSSASLRRKLFLDGHVSGSECSLPPSPQVELCEIPAASLGVLCSIDLSPVRCRSPMQTPSSGQFSSSPIQGGRRAYSLGSNTSPTFLEHSPSRVTSPAFSPIAVRMEEQKKLSFPSPDTLSASKSMVFSCAGSPYIEGCSPIKNFFQIRSRVCRGNSQYRTSLFQIPFALDRPEEDKENSPPSSILSEGDNAGHNLDIYPPDVQLVKDNIPVVSADVCELQGSPPITEELKDNDTVEMVDPVEDDHIWVKDGAVTGNTPMTSFMNGMTFSVESSHMCMSPLAESSVIPSESSSIQVDSGYTTQTCGSSIMDGIDGACKENEFPQYEIHSRPQNLRLKEYSGVDFKSHFGQKELDSPECQKHTQKAGGRLIVPTVNNPGAWKLYNEHPFNRLQKNVRHQSPPNIVDGKPLTQNLQ